MINLLRHKIEAICFFVLFFSHELRGLELALHVGGGLHEDSSKAEWCSGSFRQGALNSLLVSL